MKAGRGTVVDTAEEIRLVVPFIATVRASYPDLLISVERAERMVELGVPREGVLIDPTHDFGKNTWHSLVGGASWRGQLAGRVSAKAV